MAVEETMNLSCTRCISLNGLFHHDLHDRKILLIDSVEENKLRFSEHEWEKAVRVREDCVKVGHSSLADCKALMKNQLIHNCPTLKKGIVIAEKIFGPNVHGSDGKVVCTRPTHVETDHVEVPHDISKDHKNVFLVADVFFVNGHKGHQMQCHSRFR